MNTYDNFNWYDSDFDKNQFEDTTEFFDMLYQKIKITAVFPLTYKSIIKVPEKLSIIASYDFDRKTDQNAYIILKLFNANDVHYRLIIAERKYSCWNIGGILTKFELSAFETNTLNMLVKILPREIITIIYKKKMPYNQSNKSNMSLGKLLLKKIFK